MNTNEILSALEAVYKQPLIRDRSFYPQFRQGWDKVFDKALSREKSYLPENRAAVFTVRHSFEGFDLEFNFDQPKIAQWYQNELSRHSKNIFVAKRLKRSRDGKLSFHDSPCHYDPSASESALGDDIKNIVACALPALPPELSIIYGNKWVADKINPFHNASVSFFLINTDYVPAFLCSDIEVCLYLFLMDVCIIKENHTKVKDEDLRQFLHILRPSPMLTVKGLI